VRLFALKVTDCRLTDRVIQGKVEDIELPVKEVDVIISEWMVSLYLVCGVAS
jgi:hypothetical protein